MHVVNGRAEERVARFIRGLERNSDVRPAMQGEAAQSVWPKVDLPYVESDCGRGKAERSGGLSARQTSGSARRPFVYAAQKG
jgi:hypothetical protein